MWLFASEVSADYHNITCVHAITQIIHHIYDKYPVVEMMQMGFQLYHSSDMMYELRRREPEPTLLPTQGILNPLQPYRHGMRGTGLW